MGLDFSKFEWTPNTMGKNWMSVCNFYGNMMPFLGQTLWQVGPMPFITQGWFPNTNYGNWGDQFVSSYTPGAGGGGSSTNLTEEQRETLIKQKTKIKDYVKKYNNIRKALNAYKKNLSGEAQEVFKTAIGTAYIDLNSEYKVGNIDNNNNLKSIASTLAKAEDKYNAILKIYNNYNNDKTVENAYKEYILEEQKLAKATNSEYNYEVTEVSDWISAPTESLPLLEKEDNGNHTWLNDIDIMDFLSTWNSTENKEHLIKEIISKYNSNNLDNVQKESLKTFTEKLCDQLRVRAKDIKRNELSDSTKDLLNKAIEAFPSSIGSSGLKPDQNLDTEFDNLYKAVRLAEAEIADKELEEAFDFLGAENPYKSNENFNATKKDLEREDIDVSLVETPSANSPIEENENPTPANDPQAANLPKITIGDYVYHYDEEKKIFIDTYDTKHTADELRITDFVLNENGNYSYKKDGNTVTGRVT